MNKLKKIILLLLISLGTENATAQSPAMTTDTHLVDLSQQLLLAAKTQEPTDSLVKILAESTEASLAAQLVTDDQKKAFWINLYNAFTQIILSKNPDKYASRNSFFGDPQIVVAGNKLSLDKIEHGILRHSKVKWGLGYLNKWFPASFEKKTRVNKVDYRIHFALNCGAKSCPPIAFYKPEQLQKQLDVATSVYLKGESEYKADQNKVYVPALLSWFRGDFGGIGKIKDLLKTLSIIPSEKNPSIVYKKYDWELFLENYKK